MAKDPTTETRTGQQVDDNIDDLGRPVNAGEREDDKETPPKPGSRRDEDRDEKGGEI